MTDSQIHLGWLPQRPEWAGCLDRARKSEPETAANGLIDLAGTRMDFVQTMRLDRAVQQLQHEVRSRFPDSAAIRLAVIGSSTLTHLIPAIRVGALRRQLWVDVYEAPYGMYRQEMQDPDSGLHQFRPDFILLCLDAHHLLGAETSGVDETLDSIRALWKQAKSALGSVIIHQTTLPVFVPLLGNNEHRYHASSRARVSRLNALLRDAADSDGVHLLAIDELAARDGVALWHEEALWHQSKQEIHPRVSHVYGDQVGRLLAAARGKSYKCLVLDLDNTLWGGVIGDDGLSGIVLGQGSALGEAHLALQKYALELSRRGVILAVCSKNDEAVALEAFDKHPEMLLRREHIACFVANWDDKASNLRAIAKRLNIGIDSLVFVDDNPFERNLVRTELPQVAVPELPEDAAQYVNCIAEAGYFESLGITTDDQQRNEQYRANAEREALRESVTDLDAYLRGLNMELRYSHFSEIGLTRIVQLLNKTNQFNLTTRRYTEVEVQNLLGDSSVLHLQLRLTDRFGDNGVIGLIIGRLNADRQLTIETWLMSCRVLGRQVELATLNVLIRSATAMGARELIGQYIPTAKNGMVKDHYQKLGFQLCQEVANRTTWQLDLATTADHVVPMSIVQENQ